MFDLYSCEMLKVTQMQRMIRYNELIKIYAIFEECLDLTWQVPPQASFKV